ncbi:hypothetical protein [Rhodopseudomonas sp.]
MALDEKLAALRSGNRRLQRFILLRRLGGRGGADNERAAQPSGDDPA